jgi:transposase
MSYSKWHRIEPQLPRGRRGAHRVDDRRVISRIIQMLRSSALWQDRSAAYGPNTMVYNRWSRQGIWLGIFETLTGQNPVIGAAAIDSTHIKAHRSAGGAKGGASRLQVANIRSGPLGGGQSGNVAGGSVGDEIRKILTDHGLIEIAQIDRAYSRQQRPHWSACDKAQKASHCRR